jgi:outer membrane receptor protein involved in Fe transport
LRPAPHPLPACGLLAVAIATTPAPVRAAGLTAPAVVVTATREQALLVETPASIGVIPEDALRLVRPTHPSQILGQIPGVGVAVTNGEGHTTAIRQGFTTSPVYLFLEDGVPTRSTGFFNHNALYEINIPQAAAIEVTRGPGSALYGSDAIGGIVNVLTRRPPDSTEVSASGELGSFGWQRLLASAGTRSGADGVRADLNLTHTDGWRDRTAYDRQGGTMRWDRQIDGDRSLRTVLAFSNIDQETGANSPLVSADYLNNPTRNNTPIAYRKVQALRLYSAYEQRFGDSLLSLTPYVRHDSMDLLASFTLSSDPTVYDTANQSYGLQAKWRTDFVPLRARLIAGVDLDVSPGGRVEDRLNVTSTGTGASRVYTAYTVGPRIYDYDVTFRGISPYVHGEISPLDRLRITAGLRYDDLGYRFDNHFAATPVSAGGRFYGQSPDTSVSFSRASPKLGATWEVAPGTHLFASWNQGFRAPSESQLFRPSSATSAAQATASAQSALRLRPITATQMEIGVRGSLGPVAYDVAVYDLRKKNDIVSLRDTATNFTESVNAGETRHRGIEVGLEAPLTATVSASLAASWARHTYERWVAFSSSAGTNVDYSGREIESSPRIMAGPRIAWAPADAVRVQLEWTRLGAYWMDQANTARYGGHDLFNVRGTWALGRQVSLFGSVVNLGDRRYADSASISSSTQVFSPGLPRTLYAGVEARW